ncbi:putative periplasmic or secreted lipoprotein [Hyella patelloides LEGE 07179]|uniref:Putative periplasmic or secreted lipoprotein n=1 Tax=Hyella patelloides LEGE 07179 TaxID=945734 RepID=A0A563W5H3_9CYAN|nr:BON domain-containing protein [Hyella patelloides]VEP18949.1 putative periplasmic or secreted lipoprotein [Hyella patelloides LEGE 07179]
MNKLATLLLSSSLLFGAVGCDTARTSADAPDSVDENPVVEDATEVEDSLEDASSEIRQDQLNSDIRAREQRYDALGEPEDRADSDLESEVRAKLEANIPRSKLTVDAEDGKVAIVGTVPNQKEYETIEPLAKEILGVKAVTMEVEVVPPTES